MQPAESDTPARARKAHARALPPRWFTEAHAPHARDVQGIGNLTAKLVRETLERQLQMEGGALKGFKQQLSDMIDEAMFGSEQGDERQTQPKRQCVATESTQPVRT